MKVEEVKIRCPYCNSEDVEYVDDICTEVDMDGGSSHNRYACNNEECYENFYVFMVVDTIKVEVSKEKYSNYETIFDKNKEV